MNNGMLEGPKDLLTVDLLMTRYYLQVAYQCTLDSDRFWSETRRALR